MRCGVLEQPRQHQAGPLEAAVDGVPVDPLPGAVHGLSRCTLGFAARADKPASGSDRMPRATGFLSFERIPSVCRGSVSLSGAWRISLARNRPAPPVNTAMICG